MGQTRGQIKADIQSNLEDLNLNFYSDDDLNNAIQDAYDDVVILTQCIQNKITLTWIGNLSYYNFKKLGVPDYLGTIAIFNNVTNLWLQDNINLKDFDRLRRDWETWIGTPRYWAPSDPNNIAIAAKYPSPTVPAGAAFFYKAFSTAYYTGLNTDSPEGTFNLLYWATAPTLVSEFDTFQIASDMQQMLSQYSTADLLEQAQEFGKAKPYWDLYYENVSDYADRVKRNNAADLLLRI